MLTLQLLKLVSTVTSTDVLVYEGLRGKRFNFWRILNLVMVRISMSSMFTSNETEMEHTTPVP